MDKTELYKLLQKNAPSVTAADIPYLRRLTEDYPYFSIPHILIAKYYQKAEHADFEKQLKLAACYIGSRERLYHHLNSNSETIIKEKNIQENWQKKAAVSERYVGADKHQPGDINPVETQENTEQPHAAHWEDADFWNVEEIETEETIAIEDSMEPPEDILEIVEKNEEVIEPVAEEPIEFEIEENPQAEEIISHEIEESDEAKIAEENSIEAETESEIEIRDFEVAVENPEEKTEEESSIFEEAVESSESIQGLEEIREPEAIEVEAITEEETISEVEIPSETASEKEEVATEPSFEPIEEKPKEAATFTNWLDKLQGNKSFGSNISRVTSHYKDDLLQKEQTKPVNKDKQEIDALINKFIKEEPRIKQKNVKFYSAEVMVQRSVAEDYSLATETLANIYEKQGLFEKAIEIFNQLSLRYPQKINYFAVKIEELKKKTS